MDHGQNKEIVSLTYVQCKDTTHDNRCDQCFVVEQQQCTMPRTIGCAWVMLKLVTALNFNIWEIAQRSSISVRESYMNM